MYAYTAWCAPSIIFFSFSFGSKGFPQTQMLFLYCRSKYMCEWRRWYLRELRDEMNITSQDGNKNSSSMGWKLSHNFEIFALSLSCHEIFFFISLTLECYYYYFHFLYCCCCCSMFWIKGDKCNAPSLYLNNDDLNILHFYDSFTQTHTYTYLCLYDDNDYIFSCRDIF